MSGRKRKQESDSGSNVKQQHFSVDHVVCDEENRALYKSLVDAQDVISNLLEIPSLEENLKQSLLLKHVYNSFIQIQLLWKELIDRRMLEKNGGTPNTICQRKIENTPEDILLQKLKEVSEYYGHNRGEKIGSDDIRNITDRIIDVLDECKRLDIVGEAIIVEISHAAILPIVDTLTYGKVMRSEINVTADNYSLEDGIDIGASIRERIAAAANIRSDTKSDGCRSHDIMRQLLYYIEVAILVNLFLLRHHRVHNEIPNPEEFDLSIQTLIIALAEQLVSGMSVAEAEECQQLINDRMDRVDVLSMDQYRVAVTCELHKALVTLSERRGTRDETRKEDEMD